MKRSINCSNLRRPIATLRTMTGAPRRITKTCSRFSLTTYSMMAERSSGSSGASDAIDARVPAPRDARKRGRFASTMARNVSSSSRAFSIAARSPPVFASTNCFSRLRSSARIAGGTSASAFERVLSRISSSERAFARSATSSASRTRPSSTRRSTSIEYASAAGSKNTATCCGVPAAPARSISP